MSVHNENEKGGLVLQVFGKKKELESALEGTSHVAQIIEWRRGLRPPKNGVRDEFWYPKYGVFRCMEDFKTWFGQQPKPCRGVCELIPATERCKLYGDFDSKEGSKMEEVELFVERTKARLVELGVVTADWEPVYSLADGSREGKFSIHIVVNNVVFNTVAEMGAFVDSLGEIESLDEKVYRSGGLSALRLPDTYKWTDPLQTRMVVLGEGKTWADLIVRYSEGDHYPNTAFVTYETESSAAPGTKRKRRRVAVKIGKDAPQIVRWAQQVLGDGHRVEWKGEGQGMYVHTNGQRDCVCTPGETHQSNNGVINVSNTGDCTFHCYGCPDSPSYYMGNWKTVAGGEEMIDTIEDCPIHVVEEVGQRYLSPITDEFKATIILAHMGDGKTHSALEYIKAHPRASILVVGCRRSMDATVHGRYNRELEQCGGSGSRPLVDLLAEEEDNALFEHYSKSTWASRLVIEYESLHRLDPVQQRWDIVILDEVRSMLGASVSVATNRDNIQVNRMNLLDAIYGSQKVIMCDAHLECDRAVKEFIGGLFLSPVLLQNGVTSVLKPEEVELIRHRSVNPPRNYQILTDEGKFMNMVRDCVQSGLKIGLACGSKTKEAQLYERLVVEWCPTAVVKLYTGDSRDSVKQEWHNPDEALEGVDVVIFTSTVTVAADVTLPFDRVFMSAQHNGGCTPRDLMQMSGRFRNVRHDRIYVLMPPGQTLSAPTRFEEFLQFHETRVADMKAHGFHIVRTPDGMERRPTWVGYLHALSMDERQFPQRTARIIQLALQGGGTVWIDRAVVEGPLYGEADELVKIAKGTKEERCFEVASVIPDVREYLDRLNREVAMADDALIVQYFNALSHFRGATLELPDIKLYEAHHLAVKLRSVVLRRYREGEPDVVNLLEYDDRRREGRDEDGFVSYFAIYRATEDLFRLLELENLNDLGTQWTPQLLDAKADEIIAKTAEIWRLCGYTGSPTKRKQKRAKASGSISAVVKQVLGYETEYAEKTQVGGVRGRPSWFKSDDDIDVLASTFHWGESG